MQEKFPSETHIPSVHPENILVLQMIPGVGIRKMMDLTVVLNSNVTP